MGLEQWSAFLYYPLGLAPSLFFFLRFFIQWVRSEKQKKSVVDKTFWQLSLYGSVLLALHYFIQLQDLFLMVQVINIGISCRNLSLMQEEKKRLSARSVISFLCLMGAVSAAFFFYKFSFTESIDLFSAPLGMKQGQGLEQEGEAVGLGLGIGWKMIGIAGSVLFASRFIVQWWESERKGKSELGKAFWVLSLFGSGLSLAYCLVIHDRVSMLHYAFGLVPYMRNLLLMRRKVISSA